MKNKRNWIQYLASVHANSYYITEIKLNTSHSNFASQLIALLESCKYVYYMRISSERLATTENAAVQITVLYWPYDIIINAP